MNLKQRNYLPYPVGSTATTPLHLIIIIIIIIMMMMMMMMMILLTVFPRGGSSSVNIYSKVIYN